MDAYEEENREIRLRRVAVAEPLSPCPLAAVRGQCFQAAGRLVPQDLQGLLALQAKTLTLPLFWQGWR